MTALETTRKPVKAYKGIAMEGLIASWYARITLNDLKRHRLMAAHLASQIPAGGHVLEIAPGPGYFCIELAKLGHFTISGLDISQSFVEIASKNARQAGLAIDFRQGNASQLPFPAESFDFTFCQAAFKNFTDPVAAIAEMHRVLKPGGAAVIADMRGDATPQELEKEAAGMDLNPINQAMVLWTFKHMLLKNAYSLAQMRAMIAQTPFGEGKFEVSGIGFEVWMRK